MFLFVFCSGTNAQMEGMNQLETFCQVKRKHKHKKINVIY